MWCDPGPVERNLDVQYKSAVPPVPFTRFGYRDRARARLSRRILYKADGGGRIDTIARAESPTPDWNSRRRVVAVAGSAPGLVGGKDWLASTSAPTIGSTPKPKMRPRHPATTRDAMDRTLCRWGSYRTRVTPSGPYGPLGVARCAGAEECRIPPRVDARDVVEAAGAWNRLPRCRATDRRRHRTHPADPAARWGYPMRTSRRWHRVCASVRPGRSAVRRAAGGPADMATGGGPSRSRGSCAARRAAGPPPQAGRVAAAPRAAGRQ